VKVEKWERRREERGERREQNKGVSQVIQYSRTKVRDLQVL